MRLTITFQSTVPILKMIQRFTSQVETFIEPLTRKRHIKHCYLIIVSMQSSIALAEIFYGQGLGRYLIAFKPLNFFLKLFYFSILLVCKYEKCSEKFLCFLEIIFQFLESTFPFQVSFLTCFPYSFHFFCNSQFFSRPDLICGTFGRHPLGRQGRFSDRRLTRNWE